PYFIFFRLPLFLECLGTTQQEAFERGGLGGGEHLICVCGRLNFKGDMVVGGK
ncbi:hypothetical protein SK128_019454, partial [Halocaridina rubra]